MFKNADCGCYNIAAVVGEAEFELAGLNWTKNLYNNFIARM